MHGFDLCTYSSVLTFPVPLGDTSIAATSAKSHSCDQPAGCLLRLPVQTRQWNLTHFILNSLGGEVWHCIHSLLLLVTLSPQGNKKSFEMKMKQAFWWLHSLDPVLLWNAGNSKSAIGSSFHELSGFISNT